MAHFYRMLGLVAGAQVSTLPWPDADTHVHIEYTVVAVGEILDGGAGYTVSLNYPRRVESVNDQPFGLWLADRALGRRVTLVLDADDAPVDLEFEEPFLDPC